MSDHVRPTAEDLENNLTKAIEEIEQSETESSTQQETSGAGDKPEETIQTSSDVDSESVDAEATAATEEDASEIKEPEEETTTEETKPEESTQESETQETQAEVDYKKKFTESQREAIVQTAQRNELEKVIDGAVTVPEPTEEELRVEYPEWDDMTVIEQRLAKKELWNDKRFATIEQAGVERKNIQEWNEKVDKFVEDPANLNEYPELEGKTEEFKQFATKPTRRGLNFDDLVLAFNGELARSQKKHTGKMFETGGNAAKEKMTPKNTKLSIEESMKLRSTNYDKWKELLRQGKIEMAVS